MCLGVPGRVERIWSVDGTARGMVDFGGVRKEVCLAYTPEVSVDEYVIVHVGFAITRLDEASALETLALFRSIGALEEEFADPLGQQAGTESTGTQPGTDPLGHQPGTGSPGTQPGTDQPGTQPGTGQPGTQPGTGQPGTQPGTGPLAAHPPAAGDLR